MNTAIHSSSALLLKAFTLTSRWAIVAAVAMLMPATAFSQCTIASGNTLVATQTPPCTGTITVNGTLQIDTDIDWTNDGVVNIDISGPGALMTFPGVQNTLYLAAGSTVVLSNGGLLDLSTPCTNTDKIYIGVPFPAPGGSQAFASCAGGGNSDYIFADLNNYASGITASAATTDATPCQGEPFTLSVTASVNFAPQTISWTGTGPGGFTWSNNSNQSSINFTYSATPGTNTYSQAGVYTFIAKVKDGLGNYKTSTVTVTVGTAGCDIYWTGATSTDWNTGGNWSSGSVPLAANNANIPNQTNDPVIAANVTINNITLAAGATLGVNSGGSLTLNGTLANAGAVTIQSGGSFLQGGSSSISGAGTFTVKRQGTPSATKFNYWSTPVVGGTLPGTNGYQYISANGTNTNTDDNPGPDPGWSAFSGTMATGKGYASRGANLASFTGTPNNGPYTVGVTYYGLAPNSTLPNSDFVLLGNPYPSGLTVNTFLTDNSARLSGQVWAWDDDNSNGVNYATGDYASRTTAGSTSGGNGNTISAQIATCQGFMAKAISSGNVVFNNAQRNTAAGTFLKTEEETSRIWLSLANDTLYNELNVVFMEGATNAFDHMLDGQKLRGNTHIAFAVKPEGTTAIEDELCIAALPPVTEETVVALTAFVAQEGMYTISNKAVENMNNTAVFLEDRLAGSFTDLSGLGHYTTLMNAQNTINRFYLHFAPMATGIKENNGAAFVAYTNANELTILVNANQIKEAVQQLTLTDMTGKTVVMQNLAGQYNNVYKVTLPALAQGMYAVTLQTNASLYSSKIVIR